MLSSLLDALPRPPAEASHLLVRAGRPGLLLSVATELLERCFEEGAHAETLLRRRFREDHRLGSKDRAILKDGLYATLRRHESAALLLGLGGWDGARAPLALWLAQLVREGGLPPALAAETFGAPIFEPLRDDRASLRAWAESTKPDDLTLLSLMGSLPRWLAAAWLDELGPAEAARLVSALAERAPIGLRANRLKTDRDRARAALAAEGIPAEPGALAPDALLVRESANVAGGRAFREGLVEIQDEGSQLIAAMVEPPPKGLIVDFCAGAGGKSLAIAPKLRDRQRLWAFDVRADAIKRARQRRRPRLAPELTQRQQPPPGMPRQERLHDALVLCAKQRAGGVHHPGPRRRAARRHGQGAVGGDDVKPHKLRPGAGGGAGGWGVLGAHTPSAWDGRVFCGGVGGAGVSGVGRRGDLDAWEPAPHRSWSATASPGPLARDRRGGGASGLSVGS